MSAVMAAVSVISCEFQRCVTNLIFLSGKS